MEEQELTWKTTARERTSSSLMGQCSLMMGSTGEGRAREQSTVLVFKCLEDLHRKESLLGVAVNVRA